MAVKKKKKAGKKKKKSSLKKQDSGEEAFQPPEFVDPRKFVTLEIMLAEPAFAPSMKEFTDFTLEVPDTTKVDWVRRKIIEHHGGAISGVRICYNVMTPESALDPTKKLKDCAIQNDQTSHRLFYDFDPISHPLLTSAIGTTAMAP